MARVFLVEKPRGDFDLRPAEVYGDVVTVFADRDRSAARPTTFYPEEFARTFLKGLAEHGFDPLTDYFLMTGGTAPVAIAFAALAVRYRSFKALVFNGTMREYVEKSFNADAVLGTWERRAEKQAERQAV